MTELKKEFFQEDFFLFCFYVRPLVTKLIHSKNNASTLFLCKNQGCRTYQIDQKMIKCNQKSVDQFRTLNQNKGSN